MHARPLHRLLGRLETVFDTSKKSTGFWSTVGLDLVAETASGRPPPDSQLNELFMSAAAWFVVWLASFYLLALTFPIWGKALQLSTKPHENDRFWCTRCVVGIVHAGVVSLLCLPPLVEMAYAPEHVRFASTDLLGQCEVSASETELLPWNTTSKAVAMAGLIFTSFTAADMIISVVHQMATADFIVHHIAFISAGVLIRGHCILPFNAAILLCMEVSTPFLNFLLLFRHRGEGFHRSVIGAGLLFVFTYFLFRICLNGYGTYLLVQKQVKGEAVPSKVPRWQGWTLVVMVSAGAFVQLFWLPLIWNSFGHKLKELLSREMGSAPAPTRATHCHHYEPLGPTSAAGGHPTALPLTDRPAST